MIRSHQKGVQPRRIGRIDTNEPEEHLPLARLLYLETDIDSVLPLRCDPAHLD